MKKRGQVKMPDASEPPRCAPPHTFRAGEEPEEGGGTGNNQLVVIDAKIEA